MAPPRKASLPSPQHLLTFGPLVGGPQEQRGAAALLLSPDELAALRLADAQGLAHDVVGAELGVSRATAGRLIQSARRKVATALVTGDYLQLDASSLPSQRSNKEMHSEPTKTANSTTTETLLLPTEDALGARGQLSDRFGHAPYFTLVTLKDGAAENYRVERNPYYEQHVKGRVPVFVKGLAPSAVISTHVGPAAARALRHYGIRTVFTSPAPVAVVLSDYLAGKLSETPKQECHGGDGGCRHHGQTGDQRHHEHASGCCHQDQQDGDCQHASGCRHDQSRR